MPQVGESLPISFRLHDGDNTKFVLCKLKFANGTAYGAPFGCVNVGDGQYSDNTHLMPPGTNFVTAAFEVFSDAGFSIESPAHFGGTSTFPLEVPNTVILDAVNELKALIIAGATTGELVGVLDSITELLGTIEEKELIGHVEKPEEFSGDLTEQNLEGLIDDGEE